MSLFDAEPSGDPFGPVSNDPTCEVCGTPLTYAGKGRKPKFCDEHKSSRSKSSGNTTTRGKVSERDLNQACNNLRDTYDALGIPLAFLSPPAAQVWDGQIPGLDERNHRYLAGNPDLVKRINAVGEKGGTFAFILSHVVAVVPVVMVLTVQARGARAASQQEYPQPYDYDVPPQETDPVAGTPFDPDAAFA